MSLFAGERSGSAAGRCNRLLAGDLHEFDPVVKLLLLHPQALGPLGFAMPPSQNLHQCRLLVGTQAGATFCARQQLHDGSEVLNLVRGILLFALRQEVEGDADEEPSNDRTVAPAGPGQLKGRDSEVPLLGSALQVLEAGKKQLVRLLPEGEGRNNQPSDEADQCGDYGCGSVGHHLIIRLTSNYAATCGISRQYGSYAAEGV